jgi:hypothetical protein
MINFDNCLFFVRIAALQISTLPVEDQLLIALTTRSRAWESSKSGITQRWRFAGQAFGVGLKMERMIKREGRECLALRLHRCGAALVIVVLAISSCADPASNSGRQRDARETSMHSTEPSNLIRSETLALASAVRPYALIIEHPETLKFLQIFYDLEEGYFIDLPSQTLDDMELVRAKIALAALGVEFESWEVFSTKAALQQGFKAASTLKRGPSLRMPSMQPKLLPGRSSTGMRVSG